MLLFGKKSSTPAFEENTKITSINLERVVSVMIIDKEEKFSSRFFVGKKRDSSNYQITVGIKDTFSLNEVDFVTIIFNMIDGERFSQTGTIAKIENQFITIDLDEKINKIEERRKSLKIQCNLSGEITIMNKTISVEIKNISIGGVFVATEADLPLHNVLFIKINEIDVVADITVIRQQKDKLGTIIGYGCQFYKLNDRNEEKIFQYINNCLLKERQTLINRDVYNYF